jgi:hypothetical protein
MIFSIKNTLITNFFGEKDAKVKFYHYKSCRLFIKEGLLLIFCGISDNSMSGREGSCTEAKVDAV